LLRDDGENVLKFS